MGVKIRTVKNDIPKMQKTYAALNGKKIQVGVFGEQAYIAGVHEYGCNMTAKNSRYLTIPCSKKSFGKRARDFNDLFFIEGKSGEKFLAREVGKEKIECLFWLTKSVHIPERSFLRAGHDENIDEVITKCERLQKSLGSGAMSVDEYCNAIGQLLADRIKKYARDLKTPPKSSITLAAAPSKTNPLVNTGDMIGAINYRVE